MAPQIMVRTARDERSLDRRIVELAASCDSRMTVRNSKEWHGKELSTLFLQTSFKRGDRAKSQSSNFRYGLSNSGPF